MPPYNRFKDKGFWLKKSPPHNTGGLLIFDVNAY
jgi:hypothetical protein